MITPARQIEVQMIADGQGSAWPLGARDCSYRRRHHKVIVESASPALTEDQEHEVMEAARRLMLRAGYRNAGTVEFLYEPAEKRFWFMEVRPRLQAEHPVTEAVTGLDLVKLQLHVAGGGRLEGDPPVPQGHAIEARLNAEDPALAFAPAPGRLALLRLPTGPGVRVDTGVSEGDAIPAEFDTMIGKLIAWGRDRSEALARLRRAVADTVVVVEGGSTNQGFLLELLDRPEVRSGDVDTGWLDLLCRTGQAVSGRHGDIALLQAAIELADSDLAIDRARFFAYARRGRPQAAAGLTRAYELRHQGVSYRLAVAQVGPEEYRIDVHGHGIELRAHRISSHERRLELQGEAYRTLSSRQEEDLLIEVRGVPHRISRDDGGIVRNPSPAVVVSIPVTRRRDRRGRRRGGGRRGDEDAVIVDGAVAWPRQARARGRERAGRGACAAGRDRSAGRRTAVAVGQPAGLRLAGRRTRADRAGPLSREPATDGVARARLRHRRARGAAHDRRPARRVR